MNDLKELLATLFNGDLIELILSGTKHSDVSATKIKMRPVLLKGALSFQAAAYTGKQVKHSNLSAGEAEVAVAQWLLQDYKQAQIKTRTRNISVLCSKKGQVTIKQKAAANGCASLEHNRLKSYILNEGEPIGFLIDLGVMTQDGRIVKSKYDKFRQINRFLEFIEDIIPSLPKDREMTMIDFGCGKSYLTFAMYYYLRELKGFDLRIIGLDLKEDVIEHCNGLSKKYGFEKLDFYCGDIADYEGVDKVDMVVTLHACDTATDFALAKAIAWGAEVILSVPCCQHELNGQIQCQALEPVLGYGLLKERMAALVTDGLRAALLEEQGYKTQILEFIDMAHTPKNILIRAIKDHKPAKTHSQAYLDCVHLLQVAPTLETLLNK